MLRNFCLPVVCLGLLSHPPPAGAAIVGTNSTDQFGWNGTLQSLDTTLTNSYSGLSVALNGTFNVNTETYDGQGGRDFLFGTDFSDVLIMDAATPTPVVVDIEVFVLGDGDDVLDLSSLTFNLGDTSVIGGADDDIVWANRGDDFLRGDEGNDVLDGGPGNDDILGGADNDVIHFALGYGIDDIDGGTGTDEILFAAGISSADLIITPAGGSPDLLAFTILVGVQGDQINATDVELLRFSDGGTLDLTTIPEPASVALLGTSAFFILTRRRVVHA